MKEWFIDHSLIIMLVIAAIFSFVWLRMNSKRLGIKTPAAAVISVLHVAAGVLSVKAFAILESFGSAAPGAMSLFGGVFFMPVFYFLGAKLLKKKTSDIFDIFTIVIVFTLMCARVNCIFSGCCIGRQISTASSLRWPTRELELLYYIVFLVLMIPLVRRDITHGTAYPLYMLSYGIFRAIVEVFRESNSNGILHVSHIWAFISLAIGASVYIELINRQNPRRTRNKNA